MDFIALIGIAVGLSMDAFAVSVANGACAKKISPLFAAKLAFAFGLFQAVMPMIGWLIGRAGESLLTTVDHWIALFLLGFIGGQMIWEARKSAKNPDCSYQTDNIHIKTLLALAVATSIDALATGIILPNAVQAGTAPLMLLSVLTIGLITFCMSYCGVYLGRKFGLLLSGKAQFAGGIVLILIGAKIFIEHMSFELTL